MKFNKRILLIIISVLIIVGGVYYYNNSIYVKENQEIFQKESLDNKEENLITLKDETKDIENIISWKTYNNDQYGFKFNYPSSLPSTLYGDSTPKEIIENSAKIKKVTIQTGAFSVEITQDGFYKAGINIPMTLEQLLKWYPSNLKKEEIFIDGIKATKIVIPYGSTANDVTIFLSKSNKDFFKINYGVYIIKDENFYNKNDMETASQFNILYGEILSTFEFTK